MEKSFGKHSAEISLENQKNAAELEYAVQMVRWLLRPLGLWPLKSESLLGKILNWTLIFISMFLLAFLIVPTGLYVFFVEKDLGIRIKLFGPMCFCLLSTFKFNSILMKDRDIRWCIMNIAADWHEVTRESYRRLMLYNAKIARQVITISVFFMFSAGIFYHVIAPYARDPIVVGNVSIKLLPYPGNFIFFNPNVRPIYDFILLIQCSGLFVIGSVTVGVVGIAIICVAHICSQCDITTSALKEFAAGFDVSRCQEIVRQHLKSLRFAAKLEDILNDICFAEILGCTFNMCMAAYYLLTDYENSDVFGLIIYILLLSSFLFNIFILCYIGDLLTEKCERIGKVAYAIEWYELPSLNARNIILIIEASQRPVVLTAGKMVTLSISTFCNIVKASATYLNMLRTFLGNDN